MKLSLRWQATTKLTNNCTPGSVLFLYTTGKYTWILVYSLFINLGWFFVHLWLQWQLEDVHEASRFGLLLMSYWWNNFNLENDYFIFSCTAQLHEHCAFLLPIILNITRYILLTWTDLRSGQGGACVGKALIVEKKSELYSHSERFFTPHQMEFFFFFFICKRKKNLFKN